MGKWTQSGGLDVTLTQPTSDAVSPGMFRFTRKPLQSLTGASPVTLTLNPFPLGITPGSVTTTHYLRIVDSIAGNEVVLITARTATTVTFTPALSHVSGNWTIGSATNGIQEAVKWVELQANGGSVKTETGNSIVYATTSFLGAPAVSIEGHGWWNSLILADPTFATGDIFYCQGITQLLQFRDLHIARNVSSNSGAAIHLKNNTALGCVIQNVKAENCYIGLDFDSANGHTVTGFDYTQAQAANPLAFAGVYIHGTLGSGADMSFNGGHIESQQTNSANMLDFGFRIEAADGITIDDFVIRAEYGISIFGLTGQQIGTVLIDGCIADNCRINNVQIACNPGIVLFTNICISGSHLIGTLTNAPSVVIANNATATTYIGVTITNNFILGAQGDGLSVNAVRGLVVSGNQVLDNNTSATPGGVGMRLLNIADAIVSDNIVSDTRGVPTQSYGVLFGGTMDRTMVHGNVVHGNISGQISNLASPIIESLIRDNIGVEEQDPVIASAATITLPTSAPAQVFISGATNINTILGATGGAHKVTFLMMGALTFTGGNVATPFGPTFNGQKVLAEHVISTGKWYLS